MLRKRNDKKSGSNYFGLSVAFNKNRCFFASFWIVVNSIIISFSHLIYMARNELFSQLLGDSACFDQRKHENKHKKKTNTKRSISFHITECNKIVDANFLLFSLSLAGFLSFCFIQCVFPLVTICITQCFAVLFSHHLIMDYSSHGYLLHCYWCVSVPV